MGGRHAAYFPIPLPVMSRRWYTVNEVWRDWLAGSDHRVGNLQEILKDKDKSE
jgi:hypothetical protein